MISPTGLGIRNDSMGAGWYGALRGDRLHRGLDFLCEPGQRIVAPFGMRIERVARPYGDHKYGGISFMNQFSTGKIFYFEPKLSLLGFDVEQGEDIGAAQDISKRYTPPPGKKPMKPHIHFQFNSFDPEILMRLAKVITKHTP